MTQAFLLVALLAATSLSACSRGDEGLDQTGANPKLPAPDETLVPLMKIAKPQGWDGELPTVPAGFTVTAVATDLRIPRQILVLPNGDVLAYLHRRDRRRLGRTRNQRKLAAILGIAGAVGAAYVSFDLRMRAMKRWGQTPSGLVENALVLGATHLTMKGATFPPAPPPLPA